MTIGKRIKSRREELGMSQAELAEKVGYKSRSTINKIELGINEITQSKIKVISDALGVSPSYIMGWEDSLPSGAYPYTPTHKIPILGRISAGLPIYAEENIEGYTYTELNHGGEYFALRVRGDSMNAARIFDGQIVVCRRQEVVDNGEIAVVLVGDDEATVKRFFRDEDTVTLMPQSTNPEYVPQIYNLRDTRILVQGKVVQSVISY